MADPYPNSSLPVYDVTQSPYSADRTGGSDARQKIQDAIDDAASSDGKPAGGIVFIPVGEYKISGGSLTLKSNVRIVGEVGQNKQGVVLKACHGASCASDVAGDHVPVFKYVSSTVSITGWSIENLTIDFTNCLRGDTPRPPSTFEGDIGIHIAGAYLYDIQNVSVLYGHCAYKAESAGVSPNTKDCYMGTVRKLYSILCRNGIWHSAGTTMTFENCWVNANTTLTPVASYWGLGWWLNTIYGVTLTSCVLEKWKSGDEVPTGFKAEHCRGLVINGMDVEKNNTNGGRLFYLYDCEVSLNAFRTTLNEIYCPTNGTSRLVHAYRCALSLTGSAMGGPPSTGAYDIATNGGGTAEAITLEVTSDTLTSAVSIQGCRIGAPESSSFTGTRTAFKDTATASADSLAVLGTTGIANQVRTNQLQLFGQYLDINEVPTDVVRGLRVFAADQERAKVYATGNNTNHAGQIQLINGGAIGAAMRIGTAGSPNYALELTSDSAAKPSTSSWTVASDARTKDNLRPFTSGLDVLRQVLLHTWEYNGLGNTPSGETASGVLAQELQSVLPDAVVSTRLKHHVADTDQAEFLGVNYHLLILAAIQAIKEIDERVTALESHE